MYIKLQLEQPISKAEAIAEKGELPLRKMMGLVRPAAIQYSSVQFTWRAIIVLFKLFNILLLFILLN